jgi:RHS repeat-associated protein
VTGDQPGNGQSPPAPYIPQERKAPPQPPKPYTPSAIPIEELPTDHPLVDLNLSLPPQDPDITGQQIAATLQAHIEQLEREPRSTATISPEIEALADGLDNDPKLIYEYVHNHFDLVPSWGLVKSSRETYLSRVGNPFDQAALLVALLQAADYPAEFVLGLIQIPLDQAMNWVGVTDSEVLPHVFWNGGIPAEVADGMLRMNHVWARVQVDGVWYPLDPSFKAYNYQAGIDLGAAMDYGRGTFLADAVAGSTVTDDFVQDIQEANINGHLTDYATNLIDHLSDTNAFAYVSDVVGGRSIVPETLSAYPTDLPYIVESAWGETPTLPAEYAYKLHIEIPGIDYLADVPEIGGERITVFYAAATPADQAALDNAGGVYNVDPAYEVDMVPELRVGGELVATGSPVALGSWEPISVTLVTSILDGQGKAWTASYAPQWLQAGAWYALPMIFQTLSNEQLTRHHRAQIDNQAAGLPDDSEPVLGQALYNIGLSYFHQKEASQRLDAQIAGVVRTVHMRGMLMSQDLAVAEWDSVNGAWKAKRLAMAAYTIDVRLNFQVIHSSSGDVDRERGFMLDSGHKGSAIEHATLQQLQGHAAVSTIQVLDIANKGGLKIYHITADNLETVVPLLIFADRTKNSIRRDVEAGYEVIVPEANITKGEWTGTAWISLHPASGSAGYWLSGDVGQESGEAGPHLLRRGGGGTEPTPVIPSIVGGTLGIGMVLGSGPPPASGNPQNTQGKTADPVDTASGAFVHGVVDLAFGVLGFPIQFARTYGSTRNRQDGPLGWGWTHSYAISLAPSSDWTRGFGLRAAMDAVAAIAESFAGIDIASAPAGALPNAHVVIGTENADWILDEQMTDNVIAVDNGNGEQHQYLLLPGGAYRRGHGTDTTLVDNGDGSYTVAGRDGSEIAFDEEGRAAALTDANGNQTVLTYDGDGRLMRVTDAVGRFIRLSYDNGHLTQVRDPLDRTYTYGYNADGDLTTYTDARGGVTAYTYDDKHRVLAVTDPEGITFTTNEYDEWGRVTGQTNGSGAVMTLRYGDVRTDEVDPLGNRRLYFYDRHRLLVGEQDPLGYRTSTVYDARDNVLSYTDARGNLSTFSYDQRGNPTGITDPLDHSTALVYDAQDNLTSLTDALSRTTRFGYDAHRNLTSITDALGQVTGLAYDAKGQPTSLTDANGHTTTFDYDPQGNLTSVTDALGHTSTMDYDIVGRLLDATDPNGNATQFAYDAGDNLVSATDPLGHETTSTYDGNGQQTTLTDARGNVTVYGYDPEFNLTSVTDALGQVTRYAYDANNHLIQITDAKGQVTHHERDALGRLTQSTDPLGRAIQYAYDGNGNLVTKIKADGSAIQYQYDANDRLTRISYPDGSAALYEYDAVDNETRSSYGTWQAQYQYDDLDRLIRKDLPNDDLSVTYAYDPAGNIESLEARRDSTLIYQVQHTYDAADRLTRTVDGLSQQTVTYAHDASDRVTGIDYTGGAQTTYAYDAEGRVMSVENRDGSGGIMSGWAYTYESVDNTLQMTRTTPGGSLLTTYAYDDLDRLVRESYPRYSIEYEYDAVGNRTRLVSPLGTVNYGYDAADQLLSAGDAAFAYDANGNQTTRTDARGTTTYSYDYENRLAQVMTPGGIVTSLRYDAAGRRVGVAGANGERRFVYDGFDMILEEETGPGQGSAYIYGNGRLAAGRPLGAESVSMAVAYHGDALGSVVSMTDGAGLARAAYGYDAFGRSTTVTAGEESSHRFLGQWGVRAEEAVGGLHLTGFRAYDASMGRFMTADPVLGDLRDPPTLNRYGYALSNPLRYVDPAGLRPEPSKGDGDKPQDQAAEIAAQLVLHFSQALKQKARKFYAVDLPALCRIPRKHRDPEALARLQRQNTKWILAVKSRWAQKIDQYRKAKHKLMKKISSLPPDEAAEAMNAVMGLQAKIAGYTAGYERVFGTSQK